MPTVPTVPHTPQRDAILRDILRECVVPDDAIDRLVRLAIRALGAPAAVVSLAAEDRQYLKGCVGLPEPWQSRRETPLSHSFCHHVVATEEPLIIEDAREDARLSGNLAIGDMGVIAYAGIPLRMRDGEVVGSFCVIDHHPRRWSDDEIHALRDLAASVVTEIELFREAHERHLVERREERMSAAVQAAVDGIGLLGPDDRFVHLNPAHAQLYGYDTPEALVGEHWSVLYDGAERARIDAEVMPVLATGGRWRGELMGRRRDGTSFPQEISLTRTGDGGLICIVRDVSEHRRVEEERDRVLASERAARSLAENSERRAAFLADVGALLDTSLDYHSTLHRLARLAVPTLADYCLIDEVEGNAIRRMAVAHADPAREAWLFHEGTHSLDADPEFHPVVRALRSGEPILVPDFSEEVIHRIAHNPDHEARLQRLAPRSFIITPLIARGRTLGAITLVAADSGRRYGAEDLAVATELARRAALAVDNARLYREVQAVVQSRETVLAVVSHDLRNPLATILLNASSMLDTIEPERLREWEREQLEWIARSSEQMNALIEDLLDVSRIQAGRFAIDPVSCGVEAVVRDALAMLRPIASEREIDLAGELLYDAGSIGMDRERILQVISNLVGNAIKFTPRGGRVTLGAEAVEEGVRFFVSDTGPGIPEEHLPHLFDRFWQARRGARGGTGLGLAIAKGIIEAHGGQIWIESEPGCGTRVFFILPKETA